MTLYFYFARKFTMIFLGILGVFFMLMALIDLVEQISRFSARGVSLPQIFELTLLNAPKSIYDILPLVMILSTVTLFLGLSRSSELVVARAAGRSALRSLMAPVCVAALIGIVTVGMANPIVSVTSKRFNDLYDGYRNEGVDVLSISAEGLWLRQGGNEGQTVIRASNANADGTTLYDVTFLAYAPVGGPVRRIEARSATLSEGAWILTNAKVWPLTAGLNPEGLSAEHDTLSLPSTLTQDRIRDSFGTPGVISVWDLPQYIRQLQEAGFSARRHVVWLQIELARPLFLIAMVLVASAFTMRHTRFGHTGISVLAAIMLGFGLYYIRNFAQILGENGQLPVMLAAWAPPVASVLLALGILLHMEDG
ncbi:MAG: LPS export ABC transporter permease LptG [Thalassovita sp.]